MNANVEFAIEWLNSADEAGSDVDALTEARDGGRRIHDIVRKLRDHGHAEDDEHGLVDLNVSVDKSRRMLKNQLGLRAQIEVVLGAVPPVTASASRLV